MTAVRVLADGGLLVVLSGADERGNWRDGLLPTATGEVYLAGDFTQIGSGTAALPRYRIARLRADGTPDPAFDPH
ncbi:MAG TPA: delta-60 repeat domain-containing protein [Gammaproteobacteria bacterium]|nr:delta-60 repeat domain-containing protein [Gammaproteobacteria bacterium]